MGIPLPLTTVFSSCHKIELLPVMRDDTRLLVNIVPWTMDGGWLLLASVTVDYGIGNDEHGSLKIA